MEKLKEKLDFKKLNEAIGTGNKILKLLYTLLIIVVVYSLTMLVKEWGILTHTYIIYQNNEMYSILSKILLNELLIIFP